MNLPNRNLLSRTLDNVAYSRAVFPVFQTAFTLRRMFKAAVGSHFAIAPSVLFPQLEEILQQGRMTPLNAAAFMCVNSNRHDSSRYDPVKFLHNFLKLYSAQTWQECCDIENIYAGSEDYKHIQSIGNGTGTQSSRLEAIKIFCWGRDLERATRQTKFEKALNLGQHIGLHDFYRVLLKFNKDAVKPVAKGNKADQTALPKDVYLPLLRSAMDKGDITQTQCAIMLMFILHAREQRKDGESYIKHPVAVSNLVHFYGAEYLGKDNGHLWMACIAALLHDGGEKTDIDLDKDLDGLLPIEVIDAIKCLHKKDGETYFEYLERCCGNPLSAVVKLCDIYHNSSDMVNEPSTKQSFIYPISASYVEYRLRNPKQNISVAEFVKANNICTDSEFDEVNRIAESPDKKKKASEFPALREALKRIRPVKDIFSFMDFYADPRREEAFTLHP